MPGDENLAELESQLATPPETGANPQQTFAEDNGQAERLTRTSPETQGAQRTQLLAGKYKTPQELEKAYQSQARGYGELRTRAQQLEAVIDNPKFAEMARNDPEMRDMLAKLGYELREAETREDEKTGGGRWNGDVNDVHYKIEYANQVNSLRWEKFEFQQELGRKLTEQEWAAIKAQIREIPRLTVTQAWKMTPHYEAQFKAKMDKDMAALRAKTQGNRPRPVVPGQASQKLDMTKKPVDMTDAERREWLKQELEKNA